MPRTKIPWPQLFDAAAEARKRAYAPYSKFRVGAAALVEGGEIFTACHVENSSYGLSVCAERSAVFRAVAALGKRKLVALAIVTDTRTPSPPCGMCRQVMAEFADSHLPVRARTLRGREKRFRLGRLLPDAFSSAYL
jgi:cytidine deaminase